MRKWAASLCLLLGVGCAASLRTPPDVLELAGLEKAPPRARADDLLARADARWRSGGTDAVRESARLYLHAAAADPDRTEAWIGAVRARSRLVEEEATKDARRDLAVEAVQCAQWCGRRSPEDPRCVYWLGAALGLQARERKSTGLDALPRIEAAFLDAAERIPDYEHGAPARALALLYLRAPGWPRGPGDPDKGLVWARKAVEIDPDWPENRATLEEALAAQ